ncbi:hypothetical protein E5198_15725 [Pseudomonas sp. A-1]|uniref:hypothetical protein n=1 Tax=Pseudomonas sp. A-1 TaxID=1821274 RepID=UPI0010A69F78|nr:hypothetical protein [Pseudomonas sp. A-1]THG78382.1 hypothetical protein E5198_15725 [Pseudomonas sp. A-1]
MSGLEEVGMGTSLTQTLTDPATEARLRRLSARLQVPKSRLLEALLTIDEADLAAAIEGHSGRLHRTVRGKNLIDSDLRLAIAAAVRDHLEALTTVNEHIVREAARLGVASAMQELLVGAEGDRE